MGETFKGILGCVCRESFGTSEMIREADRTGVREVSTVTAPVRARSDEAHRRTVTLTIADIARFLQDALGSKLTAHIAGVTDPKMVGRWASGAVVPGAAREKRLRAAYQVFQLILEADDDHGARSWLSGMNPQLDDEAPADALRAGQIRDVMAAARAFLDGG